MKPMLQEPRRLTRTTIGYNPLTQAAKQVREAKGFFKLVDTVPADDGATSVMILVDDRGRARLEYRKARDGTVSILKNGHPHTASVTGQDQAPLEELQCEIQNLITHELATGSERRELAENLTNEETAASTRRSIQSAALRARTWCISNGKQSDDLENFGKDPSQDLITMTIAREITDRKLMHLCWGTQNQSEMDLNRYNQMALHRRELLELHSEHPKTVEYLITKVYRPGPHGPPPPLTAEELTAYLARHLELEGEAALTMAHGLAQGLWKRRDAKEVSHICRIAGALGPPGRRPATLAVIDELRGHLPSPKILDTPPPEEEPRQHRKSTRHLAAYWIALLTIYARDHDQAEAKKDMAWLKNHRTQVNRMHSYPTPPPSDRTWSEVRT